MKFIPILIVILAVIDHLLFRDVELVWPYFLLPFTVFFILYVIYAVRNRITDRFYHIFFVVIMIPVLSGLTMSLAWMAKINFIGEQLAGFFKH